MSDRPAGERPSSSASSVARTVILGIVVFGATLILLLGLTDVASRQPAASGTATGVGPTPSARSSPSASGGGASASASPSAGASSAASPPASSSASLAAGDPVLVGAGNIADCGQADAAATAAPARRDRRHRLHGRRQRVPRWLVGRLPRLLRPDMGPAGCPNAPGTWRRRLGDRAPRRLPRVLPEGVHGRSSVVRLRARDVARDRPRLGLHQGRRMRPGFCAGPMVGR